MVSPAGPQFVSGAGGTRIAYWVSGDGPPLVLVHGSMGDHSRWEVLRPHLEPHFTVYAMDRRGRGASGDGDDYAIEYEYDDVAAVADAAAGSGRPVTLYGHSYGGICAFGAAMRDAGIDRLVLYEGWPPVDPEPFRPPPGLLERLESLLASGEREAVIETALRESAGMSDDEIEAYRAQPSWPARVATADTYPREERTFAQTAFDPHEAGRINAPTLLLVGSENPPDLWKAETVAAAASEARIAVLEGQGHAADVIAPELVTEPIVEFAGEGP